MERTNHFELNKAIEQWEKFNFSQKDLTPSDKAEFKDHVLNAIDELLEKDLSEEEAFTIAKMRFGDKEDWGEEMQSLNEDNFQLKKIIQLFSGVFTYIFSFNLVLCLDKLLIIGLNYYNGDVISNLKIVKIFINIV